MIRLAACVVVLASALTACGDDPVPNVRDPEAERPGLGNAELVDGVRYRVNRLERLEPGSEFLYLDQAPGAGRGAFGLFVEACNRGDGPQPTVESITLATPSGEEFSSKSPDPDNAFAYRPQTLEPGACLPRSNSVADEISSVVVLFELPLEAADEELEARIGTASITVPG